MGVERPAPVRMGSLIVLPALTTTEVMIPSVTAGWEDAEDPLEDFEELVLDVDGLFLVEETSEFDPLEEETPVLVFDRVADPLDKIPVPDLETLDDPEMPEFDELPDFDKEEETPVPDDRRVVDDDFDWALDPMPVELDPTRVPETDERDDETSVPLLDLDDWLFVPLDAERDEDAVPVVIWRDEDRDDCTPDPVLDEDRDDCTPDPVLDNLDEP
jgi:hypothetical protein